MAGDAPRAPLPAARVALAVAGLLLVPAVAMRFTDEVNWGAADFAAAGALLFGAGMALAAVSARVQARPRRYLAYAGVLVPFAALWAELAVGIFS